MLRAEICSEETGRAASDSVIKGQNNTTVDTIASAVVFESKGFDSSANCALRSFAALKLHRSFIHYRSYYESLLPFLRKNDTDT